MPADYEVLTVAERDQWSSDYGTFQSYELLLKDYSAAVSLNRKLKDGQVPEGKVPKAGQTLYLEVNGTKAKEVQREPQDGSKDAGDEYARRPDHPDNVARMRHTSALSAAPSYYELLRAEDVIDKPQTKAEALETLKGLIQWLESTYPAPPKAHGGEDRTPFS